MFFLKYNVIQKFYNKCGFRPVHFSSFLKVVKLLLSRLPLTIVFLVLFLAFKDVVDCVLFLPEEVRPM